MVDDALESVYAIVERTYVRLQAGDVLIRCLEEGNTLPMQQMVESLVLAGPQSLSALREILAEVGQRKTQVRDDMHQVYQGLEKGLKSYGVRLLGVKNALSVARLTPSRFLTLLHDQGVDDNDTQVACLQLMQNSRGLIKNLRAHLRLLEEIANFLEDWLWGLAYQSAQQAVNDSRWFFTSQAL
jgi:hypothetical protein